MTAAFLQLVCFAEISRPGDVLLWKLLGTAAVVVLLAGVVRWLVIKNKQR